METTRAVLAGGGAGDFTTVQHIVLRGTQREIGRALAEESLAAFPPVPPPDDPVVNRARRRWVERHWPHHYARMEGIAEAMGFDLLDDRTSAVDLAATPFRPGCSALWCPPGTTDDGHPRLGRNFDFRIDSAFEVAGVDAAGEQPAMLSLPYVLETHPDDGLASVVVAACDLSGCFEGVNEAGLTVAALADDESDTLRPALQLQAGLNEIQLPRFLLDTCADVDEAIEALYTTKQYDTMFTCHYVVVDRHGEAFVWERDTHNAEHVVRADAAPLCVTNYLLHRHSSPRSLPDRDPRRPDSLPFTTDFYERARTLDRHATQRPIAVGALEAALDDVAMGTDVPGSRTLWRSIFDPEARSISLEFYLGDAPPWRGSTQLTRDLHARRGARRRLTTREAPVVDAAQIRARIDHPVIDADGHLIEYLPLLRDFLVEEAGRSVAERFDATIDSATQVRALAPDDRRRLGISRTGWWGVPSANTLDRATAMLPNLLYDRLDELGIDVAILYPTAGLMAMALDDEELRTALARAYNRYAAECYGGVSDRLLPVAVVPNYTPSEALAELEHAVGDLGLRPVLFGGLVLRAAPGHDGDRAARWVDGLGLDSAYDYDAVWARCIELGVSPTFHSTGIGFGSRTSPTNYVANHIGNFASGSEAVCRSLLFGGAMRRFPELRFAFLEGGIGWACTLFADVIGHWEKRNRASLSHYDPRALDRGQLDDLVRRYGSDAFASRLDALGPTLQFLSDPGEDPAALDEFAASDVRSVDDLREVFTEQCFFGCEADDPMNALAFDVARVPTGGRLQAMFASDIGHWDVPDFRSVLCEAWELVEDGRIDEDDFRAFTFEHAAALFTGTRPDFFAGTVVEDAIAKSR